MSSQESKTVARSAVWNKGVKTGKRAGLNKDGTARRRPGPKEPVYLELSEPPSDASDRQARRQALAEALFDATLERLTQKVRSNKCRSQDLLVAVGFLSRNKFKISPSKAGQADALDLTVMRQQQERIKELEAKLGVPRDENLPVIPEQAPSVDDGQEGK